MGTNILYILFSLLFISFSCNPKQEKIHKKNMKLKDKQIHVLDTTSFKYTPEQANKLGIRGSNFDIFSLKLLDTIPKLEIVFPNIEIKKWQKDTIILQCNYAPHDKSTLILTAKKGYYEMKKKFEGRHDDYSNTYYFYPDKVIKYKEHVSEHIDKLLKIFEYTPNKKKVFDIKKEYIRKIPVVVSQNLNINHKYCKNINTYEYVYDKKEKSIIANLFTQKNVYKKWKIYQKNNFSYFWDVFME